MEYCYTFIVALRRRMRSSQDVILGFVMLLCENSISGSGFISIKYKLTIDIYIYIFQETYSLVITKNLQFELNKSLIQK